MASHAMLRRVKTKKTLVENNHKRLTVVEYLLKRLHAFGIRHLFSFSHPDLEAIKACAIHYSKIAYIETESAFAIADGYAKACGFSALSASKDCPGFIEAVIRASNESVAQVFLLGTSEQSHDFQFDPHDHIEMALRKHTSGWTVLDDPKTAAKKIDRIIDSCLHFQKPVCIELFQEVADRVIPTHTPQKTEFQPTDQNSLQDFLLDVDELLSKAKHPAIYVARQAKAHQVDDDIYNFSERYNIPIITDGSCDLLFVFAEKIPRIAHSHLVHIALEDAFCDERRYACLYFKDSVEALYSLECRKHFKNVKDRLKHMRASFEFFLDLGLRRKCQVVTRFSKQLRTAITCEWNNPPTYSLEAAFGVKLANPAESVLVVIDENELQHSLFTLQLIQNYNIPMVITVVDSVKACKLTSDPYEWNLTELAHLFVDGRAIQIQNQKALEKAVLLALEANDGLYLIDATLLKD